MTDIEEDIAEWLVNTVQSAAGTGYYRISFNDLTDVVAELLRLRAMEQRAREVAALGEEGGAVRETARHILAGETP